MGEEKLTEKENHMVSKNEESQNIVVKQDKVTKLLENIKKKHEQSDSNKNFNEEESEFMDLNKIPDRKRKTEATRTNTKIIKNTGDKTDVNDYQISMINILSEKADRCDNVQKEFEDLKRRHVELEEKLTEKENHISRKETLFAEKC